MSSEVLPPKPDIVLRVGFAGCRNLPDDFQQQQAAIETVLSSIVHKMANLFSTDPGNTSANSIKNYYSANPPIVRLVTGLAEGADAVAFSVFKQLPKTFVHTEVAAVLGCDVVSYRNARKPKHIPKFDSMLHECAYIMAVDGNYIEGEAGKHNRARLYHAQSILLLRHVDLLIAVADPDAVSKPGSTLETIRQALAFGTPVVFIHAKKGKIFLGDNSNDLFRLFTESAFDETEQSNDNPQRQLEEWVTNIIAAPEIFLSKNREMKESDHHNAKDEVGLLDEYFNIGNKPDLMVSGKRKGLLRKKLWNIFERRFKSKPAISKRDTILEKYDIYRKRATELNYHYSGLYRGAFLLNNLVAVIAVTLATGSLLTLGYAHIENTGEHHAISGLSIILMILGGLKLICLLIILFNSRQARKEKWNYNAINYRYLAERLRSLFYLPQLGSFRPPAVESQLYSSQELGQSQADWLFEAITRSVSPETFAKEQEFNFDGKLIKVRLITVESRAALNEVKDRWIQNQLDYHDRNSSQMWRISHFLEKLGSRLNIIVIAVVVLDIFLLLNQWTGLINSIVTNILHDNSAWLVFITAVLPAIVASLNGIRFQSECDRLAERSAVVAKLLGGRTVNTDKPSANHKNNSESIGGRKKQAEDLLGHIAQHEGQGSWNMEVLHIGEDVSRVLTREVAEWSVLYAKELAEP